MMPDCLLGCHTHAHGHTDTYAHTQAACTGFMCYHLLGGKLFCKEEIIGCFKGLVLNTGKSVFMKML